MIELFFKIVHKDGSEYSDTDGVFDNIEDLKVYVKAFRNKETGYDHNSVDCVSFWDENGNEY